MSLEITGKYRYPGPRAEWLALHSEAVIDPELPIVDAHHHLWQQPDNVYLLPDLLDDLGSGHNIVATVAVEARSGYRESGPAEFRCVGETEQFAALGEGARAAGQGSDICAGIIGFADLTGGAQTERVIEAHLAAAPARFRGIRHSVSRDEHFPDGVVIKPAPAGLLANGAYRRGLKVIERLGLSYDAMLYHAQIPELTAMAQAMPGLPIVLNHFGCVLGVGVYRDRQAELFDTWRGHMVELARCPNVRVKMGGLGMIVCGPRYHEQPRPPASARLARDFRPWVETCIEQFGVERCMFESNFPVDKAMYAYSVLWNAFKRIAAGASAAEKAWLFHDTAATVYRLNLAPAAA